ncbi:MAG: hypothetical protein HOC91_17000 [Nitrospinaceae bacterium]|jgi:hypothetical protein|nr:hypothetical protein [Nitrospinaceae bacterium]MBT3434618.1 hypothetical protein [Nitrospinaceae bacterium]MBT3821799.1 hypothetical protein [Nitrospinaceae bacterium]MBT4095050.1 hypothetical protein [Nitrospinaceae bacterium]MBT4432211.1 hypothetical protein [Nitrospinaceae bacterium]
MKLRSAQLALVIVLAALSAGFFHASGAGLKSGALAPELVAGPWLNSGPLKIKNLKGKVILLKMWTFG